MLTQFAPAKINLTLRVLGRRADGYHELDSVVVFASVGDIVSFAPGEPDGIDVTGTRGAALLATVRDTADLSVVGAAAEFRKFQSVMSGRFTLDKELPTAAGVGGGTADAAATLHVLNTAAGEPFTNEQLQGLGKTLGADVPVSVYGESCRMFGTGERIVPLDVPRDISAVLVNPGIPILTSEIFRRMKAPPFSAVFEPEAIPDRETLLDLRKFVDWLQGSANDMQPHAIAHEPIIGDVLNTLGGQDDCLMVRMSGSGATCFGLFRNDAAARAASRAISEAHPTWWVRATTLNPSDDVPAYERDGSVSSVDAEGDDVEQS